MRLIDTAEMYGDGDSENLINAVIAGQRDQAFNFKVSDMEDLFRVPDGHRCATNQVRYSLDRRRFEYDLLPWCEHHGMPVMAYTPLGDGLVHDPLLTRIGAAHNCSASAVALAWTIRSGNDSLHTFPY
jgi:diketogulonate reductase-like aldo/keto reductase